MAATTTAVCELCGGTGWVQGDHSVYEPPAAGAEWCPLCQPVPVVVLTELDDRIFDYEPHDIDGIEF